MADRTYIKCPKCSGHVFFYYLDEPGQCDTCKTWYEYTFKIAETTPPLTRLKAEIEKTMRYD